MPAGDRTGPMGMGSQTGRGAGFCAGYNMPGYANRGFGPGMGRGRGGFGRGMQRGFRGGVGFGPAPAPQAVSSEAEDLRLQAQDLQAQLNAIQERLNGLTEEGGS